MEMSNDIEQALRHSYDRFIHKPEWMLLATNYGLYLGHLVMTDAPTDIERSVTLAAGASALHERLAMDYVLGTLRFGLTFADTGIVVYAFTGNSWVLTLMFAEANLIVLTSTLQVLPDIVANLAQLELTGRW
jgi:hypothetical protein